MKACVLMVEDTEQSSFSTIYTIYSMFPAI